MPIQSLVTVPLPFPVLTTVRRLRCSRPCCTTTMGMPATVTVALRAWLPMLMATDNDNVAAPAPVSGVERLIQSAVFSARQPQRLSVASETGTVVAGDPMEITVGDTPYVHAIAAAET